MPFSARQVDVGRLRPHDRPARLHLRPQEHPARRSGMVDLLVVPQRVLQQLYRLQRRESLERYRRSDDRAQRHRGHRDGNSARKDAQLESRVLRRRGSGGRLAGGFLRGAPG